jgi:hypothetical protein
MFWNNNNNPEDPGVFTGCLSNVDADLVRIVSHIFVGDTIDGGATCWLRMPNEDGSEAKRFQKRQDGQEFPAEWPDTSTLKGYETHSEEEFLPIHCHCNGVNLRLYRGNYIGKPKEELPWFIDDKNLKQIASFDACDSCRSHCGIDILNWTFASLQNISFTNSTSKFPATMHELKAAIDAQDHNLGTLGYYQSSPNVHRHFCKVCSATVFFARDERPDIVDIAVGLLDSADGARAEGFLSWTLGGGVAFADDFKGGWREGMLKQVVKESEEWRVKRGYPKNRRRVEADEKAAK